jgi:hypothetical protein
MRMCRSETLLADCSRLGLGVECVIVACEVDSYGSASVTSREAVGCGMLGAKMVRGKCGLCDWH